MVIPGALVGIEIKSDADTYARLESQVRDYNQHFDYNYIVTGSRHALHIEEHVPVWWGIVTVEEIGGEADFYLLRNARENPHVDNKKKLNLLWRPELAHIQKLNMLPKYKGKSKAFVVEKILEKVSPEMLAEQISEELFERDYDRISDTIQEYKKNRKR